MYFGRLSRWGRRAGVFEKKNKGVSEGGREGGSGVDCSNEKKNKRKEHHRLGEEEEEEEEREGELTL